MLKSSRTKCVIILEWCKTKWGISTYQTEYPKLRVYTKYKGVGESFLSFASYNYETNTINVYLKQHISYIQLCDSIIHEYIHYKKNYKEYKKIKTKMLRSGKTDEDIAFKHPHEISCIRTAKRWKQKCYNDLKKQLRSNI